MYKSEAEKIQSALLATLKGRKFRIDVTELSGELSLPQDDVEWGVVIY